MKIKVDVTQECIRMGTPGRKCSCPVAIAFIRHSDLSFSSISVDDWVIEGRYCRYLYRDDDGEMVGPYRPFRVQTPSSVRKFITDYDLGLPVSPFSFEVELE